MERKRRMPGSPRRTAKPSALELPADRAFVLQLDVRARPPRRVAGRVEHITPGQVAHVTSLRELLFFLAQALRNQARGDRQTAYARLEVGDCQDLATRTRGSATRSATPPIRRGRRKGSE